MKVLIVEDNPAVRRMLRRAIQQVASQLWECEDGADALATYTQHVPHVVLMDIRMPQMDGFAATRQIRAFDPSARIVIVTDDDEDELRVAAREAGACAYVTKENLTELATLLARLVEI